MQSPSVANEGVRAELASNPATLVRFRNAMSSNAPEAVLIIEGSNDVGSKDTRVLEAAAAALQQMVREAKSRNIRPYLATIPPQDPTRCDPFCRGMAWYLVDPMNAAIRNVAAAEGVTLVEVYQALSGNVGRYIGADGLHPTADGDAKIAETFFNALKQTLEVPTSLGPASVRTR